jgi:hypothetical protein
MGITLLNRGALFVMTLAIWARESKSTTWSIWVVMEKGGMGCLPKSKNKKRNETKRHAWTSCNPWQCKVGPGPNPLCS